MIVKIRNPEDQTVWIRENVEDVCVASNPRDHERNGQMEYGLYCSFANGDGIGTRYILKPGYAVYAWTLDDTVSPSLVRKCPARA